MLSIPDKSQAEMHHMNRGGLAMHSVEGLHKVVAMLTEEVKAPGVCAKRALIMEKLEALLNRLGGRAAIENATDSRYHREAQSSLAVWLEVETLYRMSEEKYDVGTQAELYVTHQLEIAHRVETLTKKDLATVIQEYPGKKDLVDKDKELIVDIIQLIEKVEFNQPAAAQAAQAELSEVRSLSAAFSSTSSSPLKLKDTLVRLEHFKKKLLNLQRLQTHQVKQQTHLQKLRATKEDVDTTAVLKILMDLLKEPDFRAHLLKLGLEAAKTQLANDESALQALEVKEVSEADAGDKAQHKMVVAAMEREKDAGDKISKKEAYENEHKEFVGQSESNNRAVFIIQTIMNKIRSLCDKTSTSVQSVPPTSTVTAADSSSVRSLLVAAGEAAESAWPHGPW